MSGAVPHRCVGAVHLLSATLRFASIRAVLIVPWSLVDLLASSVCNTYDSASELQIPTSWEMMGQGIESIYSTFQYRSGTLVARGVKLAD